MQLRVSSKPTLLFICFGCLDSFLQRIYASNSISVLAVLTFRLMRSFLLFSFLLIAGGHCLAKSLFTIPQADSLKQLLPSSEEKERIGLLLDLSECYSEIQIDSALRYALMAKEESERLDYDWGWMKSHYQLAKVESENNSLTKTKATLEKCMPWFRANGHERDAILCELLYVFCLDISEPARIGMSYAESVVKNAQKLGDRLILTQAWLQLYSVQSVQFVPTSFEASLDSAAKNARLSGNPFWILMTDFELIRHNDDENLQRIRQTLNLLAKARSWQTNKVMNKLYGNASARYADIGKLDSARQLVEQQIIHCEAFNSKYELGHAYHTAGYVYSNLDDKSLGTEAFEKSLQLYDELGHLQYVYSALKWLGNQYEATGVHDQAAECYIKAINLAKRLEKRHSMYFTKISLASIYKATNKVEKAEQLFLEAKAFVKTDLDGRLKNKMLTKINVRLGHLYWHTGQLELARSLLDSAFVVLQTTHPPSSILVCAYRMGVCLDMKDLQAANAIYDYVDESLRDKLPPLDFLFQTGRLRFAENNYLKAIKAFEGFIDRSSGNPYSNERKQAFDLLYHAYETLGNYEKALEAHVAFKTVNDSIERANVIENTALLTAEYELAEQEAELVRMEQEKQLQSLLMEQKNNELALNRLYILLLCISLGLIGLTSYLLYQRLRIKKRQREIENKAEKLELEKENSRAKQRLELAKAKNELFANVSHEFRTPLTLIQVPIQRHLDNARKEDKPMFESVLNNADHLLEMVDEILELSRMESGHFELQPVWFSLEAFCAQLKADFEPLFQSKNVAFTISNALDSIDIFADRNRMKMVANNLLKNAYHHVQEGGAVEFKVHALSSGLGSGIQMVFSNTGKKIPSADHLRIFDRHYRANEGHYQGSGIGLALTKQIVKLHRGEIVLNPSKEAVTEFQIRLLEVAMKPSASTERNGKPEINGMVAERLTLLKPTKNGTASDKQRILIVEDHAEMRSLLASILETDFELLLAADGAEGEAIAMKEQPNLILSDVMMPIKNGIELLQSLKGNTETSHIPVLLLTARADTESRILGLDHDADGYIEKPFEPSALIARIHNLLRQRKHLHKLFSENPFLLSKEAKCSNLDTQFLDRAQHIMEENYDDGEFSVNDFCTAIALNRNSVHNKMKALTGLSTSQYIKNFRLIKAAELLAKTEMNIIAVGEEAGFNSPQAFNKAFRERFEKTPSEFRKKAAFQMSQ